MASGKEEKDDSSMDTAEFPHSEPADLAPPPGASIGAPSSLDDDGDDDGGGGYAVGTFLRDRPPLIDLAPVALQPEEVKTTWIAELLPWASETPISAGAYNKQICWKHCDFYYANMERNPETSRVEMKLVRAPPMKIKREFWLNVDRVYAARQSRDGQFKSFVCGYADQKKKQVEKTAEFEAKEKGKKLALKKYEEASPIKYMFWYQTSEGMHVFGGPTWILMQKAFTTEARTYFRHLIFEMDPNLCGETTTPPPPDCTAKFFKDFSTLEAFKDLKNPLLIAKSVTWIPVEPQTKEELKAVQQTPYYIFWHSPTLLCFAGQFQNSKTPGKAPFFFCEGDKLWLASNYALLVTFAFDDIHRETYIHYLRGHNIPSSTRPSTTTKRGRPEEKEEDKDKEKGEEKEGEDDKPMTAADSPAPKTEEKTKDRDGFAKPLPPSKKKEEKKEATSGWQHRSAKPAKPPVASQGDIWSDSYVPDLENQSLDDSEKMIGSEFEKAKALLAEIPKDQWTDDERQLSEQLERLQIHFDDVKAQKVHLDSLDKAGSASADGKPKIKGKGKGKDKSKRKSKSRSKSKPTTKPPADGKDKDKDKDAMEIHD